MMQAKFTEIKPLYTMPFIFPKTGNKILCAPQVL